MGTFGDANAPQIRPIDLDGSQFEIYRRIEAKHSFAFLFESLSGPHILAETSIIGYDPDAIATGYRDRLVISNRDGSDETIKTTNPILELRRIIKRHNLDQYRYMGGAVGIVEYEAASLWESRLEQTLQDAPLIKFGIYSDGILFDSIKEKPYYFHMGEDRSSEIPTSNMPQGSFSHTPIKPNLAESEFYALVQKAKTHIYNGDVFQSVLSRKFEFEYSGDAMRIYEKLRTLNPSPYLYHMKMGKRTIMGSSPEMLIRITNDKVETWPIAGTRPITGDAQQDRKLGDELKADQKEVAEHVMLVDLGRNDIGRVCKSGSVSVDNLMSIKEFSHVQHMVTHVTGTLDQKYDSFDAFCAVFPAGTVTGAPKVRAMEIISDLEPSERGGYAGAVGYFSANGSCDFAISIRSMFLDAGRGYIQSGAGSVSDSVASAEFQETEHKAGALVAALGEAAK